MNHDKLALTDSILDKLGFSEYWDENGDWGGRTLTFTDGTRFRIIDYCEKDDEDDGYGYGEGKFRGAHFTFCGWFALPKIDGDHELFFLHEMYECIQKYYPSCLPEFTEKCIKLLMRSYLPS